MSLVTVTTSAEAAEEGATTTTTKNRLQIVISESQMLKVKSNEYLTLFVSLLLKQVERVNR